MASTTTNGELIRADRERAVASALGSVRAEGLDPSDVEPLLVAYAAGEITMDEVIERTRQLAANIVAGTQTAAGMQTASSSAR